MSLSRNELRLKVLDIVAVECMRSCQRSRLWNDSVLDHQLMADKVNALVDGLMSKMDYSVGLQVETMTIQNKDELKEVLSQASPMMEVWIPKNDPSSRNELRDHVEPSKPLDDWNVTMADVRSTTEKFPIVENPVGVEPEPF